ncbi:NAD-dependent epimerase/dehydratase family protein [Legionella sp. CNM-4043-24]|uniref:NAD-dependent epimerase/dehydratase family protein n=1 Tax=Legionella sp. CNM-4043-24 TaxID=3421646 RepID=UPI00403AC8A1
MSVIKFTSFFLVGGAGFIGSHFIDALLRDKQVQRVTVFDNFSNGQAWHYQHHAHDARLHIVPGDAKSIEQLTDAMQGHELVMHFASNADIAQAIKNPSIDFNEGIVLTWHVLEAARLTGVKRIIYTSGSGVYGDMGEHASREDQGNLHPVSPYGASKLAGEAFISSYCHMFDMSACVFRFANVVGPRQTHGVAYDFIRRLSVQNENLRILGDGRQRKSYIDIEDIVSAVMLVNERMNGVFDVYNVASDDCISVKEIADIVIESMGITHAVPYEYTGGSKGWPGDVPVVRLNTDKLRALGWHCQHRSADAIRRAAEAMIRQHQPSACTSVT